MTNARSSFAAPPRTGIAEIPALASVRTASSLSALGGIRSSCGLSLRLRHPQELISMMQLSSHEVMRAY